jgi:predicted acetyltransferase
VVDGPVHGTVVGYAIYKLGPARPPVPYSVRVLELLSEDPAVAVALWRVVGSSGAQARDVHVSGPAEDPLFLLLDRADAGAVDAEIRWMLRLIDARAAVAARGWRPSALGRIDFAIADADAPWNAGRWRLEVEGGEATLTPGGDGTVELGIGALSTLWSGYQPAQALADTGLLRCADPEAMATLADIFTAAPPVIRDFY